MKVVLPAILLLEAVVVALAIPVALAVGGGGAGVAAVLGALALALALGSGAVRRPRGVVVGWVLQVAVVLSGLLVAPMAFLGLVFLGVWVVGVIYGAKGDALAARNRAAEAAEAAGAAAAADAAQADGAGLGPGIEGTGAGADRGVAAQPPEDRTGGAG